MRTKFCKIKSKKITTAYKTFSTNDPAKRDLERMIIEPTMLNFVPDESEHCRLTVRIDRDCLFGNVRLPLLVRRGQLLLLAFGGHTGK